jgi:acyl carrier protein
MNTEEVRKVVLDIISDIAPDEDVSGLKDEVSLREQLDLDSMDFLDIVMELRKRHKVEVPAEDYPQLASMASCVAYLTPKMQ